VKRLQGRSHSPDQTQALGAALAPWLAAGDCVALRGDLGAGKTEFVRGAARGLGVPLELVSSPTFALVHEYPGRLTLAHIDLYRLETVSDDFLPELEEYLYGPYVTLVEWAERLGPHLPEARLEISFTWAGEQERRILLEARGRRWEGILDHLRADIPDFFY